MCLTGIETTKKSTQKQDQELAPSKSRNAATLKLNEGTEKSDEDIKRMTNKQTKMPHEEPTTMSKGKRPRKGGTLKIHRTKIKKKYKYHGARRQTSKEAAQVDGKKTNKDTSRVAMVKVHGHHLPLPSPGGEGLRKKERGFFFLRGSPKNIQENKQAQLIHRWTSATKTHKQSKGKQ
jgi:hypothetical protein